MKKVDRHRDTSGISWRTDKTMKQDYAAFREIFECEDIEYEEKSFKTTVIRQTEVPRLNREKVPPYHSLSSDVQQDADEAMERQHKWTGQKNNMSWKLDKRMNNVVLTYKGKFKGMITYTKFVARKLRCAAIIGWCFGGDLGLSTFHLFAETFKHLVKQRIAKLYVNVHAEEAELFYKQHFYVDEFERLRMQLRSVTLATDKAIMMSIVLDEFLRDEIPLSDYPRVDVTSA